MKILNNDLSVLIERWDDPGDYPSNAGSGPLPSYDYAAGLEGEVVLSLTSDESLSLLDASICDGNEFSELLEEWASELDLLPAGVLSVSKWDCSILVVDDGLHITLWDGGSVEIEFDES